MRRYETFRRVRTFHGRGAQHHVRSQGGLRSIIHELKNDTRIVDWIADERLFDGIGNIDIDEVCVSMLPSTVEVDDEIWKLTWRYALRKVILDVMER